VYDGRWRRLVGDVVWSPHGYGVSDRMFFSGTVSRGSSWTKGH